MNAVLKLRISAILLLTVVLSLVVCSAPSTLRGSVTDSATHEPIISVNIRVLGTERGTITNTQGSYALSLEPGAYRLAYSYLGYSPETLAVTIPRDTFANVALKPSPVVIPEVLVSSEDPAIEIIRKAIAHKHEWMERLKSYRFDAFTRQVLHRDTAIASITESYTSGYMQVGDTLREVIHHKRQTENIPGAENFASVGRIFNFNDDEVEVLRMNFDDHSTSYKFVGPTAKDALDNYEYTLLKTSTVNGVEVYTIHMMPKTNLKPLFEGTIVIADRTFAVMGVDLKPNELFVIPFVKDVDLRFRQQFGLYDSLFWMPTDIRLTGGFHISIVGLSFPRMGVELSSAIYDYAINTPIPDSVLHGKRLNVDSSAAVYDPTYWRNNEVLPLTAQEQRAYATLDSTQTLQKQFKPTGPLAGLTGGNDSSSESFFENADLRFNRVEGFFLGAKYASHAGSLLRVSGSVGYGFADNEPQFTAGVEWKKESISLGLTAYRTVANIPDQGYYGQIAVALAALIDKNDYRDYYLTRGFRATVAVRAHHNLQITPSFTSEHQTPADNTTNYSFFSNDKFYRINPRIDEGYLRALGVAVHYGDEPVPLDVVPANYIDLSVERSSPALASSSFDYTRYTAGLTYSMFTFGRNMLFAPMLRVRVEAGTSSGTLPLQRAFFPDTRLSAYAPFGVLRGGIPKEFAGTKFVAVQAEHNFRTLPFLLLGLPFLYRNGIELIAHGGAAQTWTGDSSSLGGWYYEAGLGVSRILDFLRFDVTYRFAEPKRFYFTLSLGQLL